MKIKINNTNQLNRLLHHNMAMVGGFFACYAITTRVDFFGNAQTANLIHLTTALLGANMYEVLLRLIGLIIYVSAAMIYVFIIKKTSKDVRIISLIFDLIAILLLSIFPEDIHPIISLYPIFFAMSFQWNAFPGSYGYASSTIFSSNNTRQTSLALAEFLCDHDKKHLHKMFFFLGSLISFHIGVAVSYYSIKLLYFKAILICTILLIPALLLILYSKKNASS